MIRDACYDNIYNYLRKKNDNIIENRYPKRITDIKAKDKRDNAKKNLDIKLNLIKLIKKQIDYYIKK